MKNMKNSMDFSFFTIRFPKNVGMPKNNPQPKAVCGHFVKNKSILETFADDLAAVGDDHEGGRLHSFDVFSQLGCLRTVHDGDNDLFGLVGKSALCLVDGGAVMKLIHNVITDELRVFTDDIEGFAEIDAFNDVVLDVSLGVNEYECLSDNTL